MDAKNFDEWLAENNNELWNNEDFARLAWEAATELAVKNLTSANTGSPKFCYDCKYGSIMEQKMVTAKYQYCPYCGAKLRVSA